MAQNDLIVEVTAAKYDTWMPAAGHSGQAQAEAAPGDGLEFTAELKNILYVQLPPVWPAVNYQHAPVAHELLHASNVYHHGEGGVREVTWDRDATHPPQQLLRAKSEAQWRAAGLDP